jgi:hypothetical protein
MKRSTLLWMFIAAALLGISRSSSYAQQMVTAPLHTRFSVLPLHGSTNSAGSADAVPAAATSSVPLWNYSGQFSSRSGGTFSGTMVGRSPFFHGARTTNINTILVPVKITMQDTGTVFDPTATDPACLPNGSVNPTTLTEQSPILSSANFSGGLSMNGVDEGITQYVDAFQRANFFDLVNPTGDSYHNVLNLLSTAPTISVNVSPSSGGTFETGFSCEPFGVMDINAFDNLVTKNLIPSLASKGVGPTNFPIFLLYNVVMSDGPPANDLGNCCILGYHSGLSSPAKLQLYSVADYDSTDTFSGTGDTSILSHEVAELYDDPTGNNQTPSWGHIGQVGGCQGNLEVGDPLSGTLFPEVTMPNGITYDLQELAFYSWFFGTPSIGAGGIFSNDGTFTSDAGSICQ